MHLMFKIYTEWVQSQLDQSISNQINSYYWNTIREYDCKKKHS